MPTRPGRTRACCGSCDALNAFSKDLKAQGNSGRVLTMVFSEFGRRVGQNASGGTDHGTAAPVYLVGDLLRPGLLGDHPSLDDLDQGDLRFNVDFRSVYAAILEDWMADKTRAEVVDAFNQAGMPTGPVYTARDVFQDDHFRVRGMLTEIDDPEVGPYTFARTAPHLSTCPEIPAGPSPALGGHTRQILEDLLGYSSQEVDQLAEKEVVGL